MGSPERFGQGTQGTPKQGQSFQIPAIQPNSRLGRSSSQSSLYSPIHSSPVQTPWYRSKPLGSDASDDDLNTPRRPNMRGHMNYDLQLEMKLAGASTPLNSVNLANNNSFISPLKKLNNLHLESEIDDRDSSKNNSESEKDFAGDKTIMNETSESESGFNNSDGLDSSPPQYINRKRQYTDSMSDLSMNTPNFKERTPHPKASTPSNITICKTAIRNPSLNGSLCEEISLCISESKLSFSQSDSTPCPIQPKRKKLRFKDDNTPSNAGNQRKRILDLSSSVKTSVSSMMAQFGNADHTSSDILNDSDNDSAIEIQPNSQLESTPNVSVQCESSTPISQSTPANSRCPSPPMSEEFGDSINGYKFIKPKVPTSRYPSNIGKGHCFSYETPKQPPRSVDMKASFVRDDFTPENFGKYKIYGEIPVTSAGLMDESGSDIHVGDKRINDPYLTPKSDLIPNDALFYKEEYMKCSDYELLPLCPPYFENQNEIDSRELVGLLVPEKVLEFYRMITFDNDGELRDLIRLERIRWHPDKWVGKFGNERVWFGPEVVNVMSQILNGLNDNR